MLRQIPKSAHPNLLVGFETNDDAGVFRLSETQALVQTMDFFTPIVDDPYWYGAISAANALSDVYAMGGTPITVMNIACFNPEMAPPEFWAEVFRGSYEKVAESGAVIVGGHTVTDNEPKFGLSVTGIIDPNRVFSNDRGTAGQDIWLSKPLGTGIVTTAAKFDAAPRSTQDAAIRSMATLNRSAMESAKAVGVQCATDITGFGLAGHLFNIARASKLTIEMEAASLPLLPDVEALISQEMLTGGGANNRAFLGDSFEIDPSVPEWYSHLIFDPQTSGGLAVLSNNPPEGYTRIGRAVSGPAKINVR